MITMFDNENVLKTAFDTIEGNGFFDKSKSCQDSYSFGGLKNQLNGIDYEEIDCIGSIYGNGGTNRYIVFSNGEIKFNEYFSNTENIKKAKDMGFELF